MPFLARVCAKISNQKYSAQIPWLPENTKYFVKKLINYLHFKNVTKMTTILNNKLDMFHWKKMCRLTQSYTLDKKCSIKINQREIIQKRNKVELWFLCTALRVIARNMHNKFGMIWTYSDKLCSGRSRQRRHRRRHHHRRK